MDTLEVVQSINAEIARLEKVRALLNGHVSTPAKRGRPSGLTVTAKPRRQMSAEGRARIVAAQKARWAKSKGK